MDREILFRGKHIHSAPENAHLDGRWIYGYLCSECYINSLELGGELLIDPETVCQYTGLTDKNGRKIFEGAIVKDVTSGNMGIVKFGVYGLRHLGFYIEWTGNCNFREDIYHWSIYRYIKVIGNIFDNPELLRRE